MSEQVSVLIIDDDAAFRFAMVKALTRRGFRVREADSGEVALTELETNAPQVGLLDLRMRGMDGLSVLRRARSARTRFIVLTGHGSVAAAVDAMKLGAFSFLEKPIDAEVLAPLIEQAAVDGERMQSRVQDGFAPPIGASEPGQKKAAACFPCRCTVRQIGSPPHQRPSCTALRLSIVNDPRTESQTRFATIPWWPG